MKTAKQAFMWCVSLISCGTLSHDHTNLTFVMRKGPAKSSPQQVPLSESSSLEIAC